jgi:Uma2 family endonuclease
MATVPASLTGQRLVLHAIDWRTYARLLRVFDGRSSVRLTYDRGALEIMTISPEHEWYKRMLGRFIEAITEQLCLALAGYGSMTFRRRRRLRGLEPDQCYWIANEATMRGRTHIDLTVDPPPDLVVEIDITSSSLNRMGIYSILKVPEVWCFDGQTLRFRLLQPDGTYTDGATSRTFPWLAPADLLPFLALRGQLDENAIVGQLRAWLCQRLAGGGGAAPTP